jgi:hypothetical protein
MFDWDSMPSVDDRNWGLGRRRLLGAGWPDLVVAVLLLLMFLRSAFRVFRA